MNLVRPLRSWLSFMVALLSIGGFLAQNADGQSAPAASQTSGSVGKKPLYTFKVVARGYWLQDYPTELKSGPKLPGQAMLTYTTDVQGGMNTHPALRLDDEGHVYYSIDSEKEIQGLSTITWYRDSKIIFDNITSHIPLFVTPDGRYASWNSSSFELNHAFIPHNFPMPHLYDNDSLTVGPENKTYKVGDKIATSGTDNIYLKAIPSVCVTPNGALRAVFRCTKSDKPYSSSLVASCTYVYLDGTISFLNNDPSYSDPDILLNPEYKNRNPRSYFYPIERGSRGIFFGNNTPYNLITKTGLSLPGTEDWDMNYRGGIVAIFPGVRELRRPLATAPDRQIVEGRQAGLTYPIQLLVMKYDEARAVASSDDGPVTPPALFSDAWVAQHAVEIPYTLILNEKDGGPATGICRLQINDAGQFVFYIEQFHIRSSAPLPKIDGVDLTGPDYGGLAQWVVVLATPQGATASLHIMVTLDKMHVGTMTVQEETPSSSAHLLTTFPVGNRTLHSNNAPTELDGNGPFPPGTWSIHTDQSGWLIMPPRHPISEGPAFIVVGDPGSLPVIRQTGIHGGRGGYNHITLGCLRLNDSDLLKLIAILKAYHGSVLPKITVSQE